MMHQPADAPIASRLPPPARLTLVAAFGLAIVVLRAAWMSDDAYITLRTIDNFWHGYGLRWNILERVQVYTHPLWMMLVSLPYGVTREPYFTTLAVSGACLIAAVALMIRRLAPWSAFVALVALTASRAFVDYSTSGLENPLSHLLLIAFCLTLLHDGVRPAAQSRTLAWLAMLCALTRLDLALLVMPALLVQVRETRVHETRVHVAGRAAARHLWRDIALAFLPLLAWHLFTLTYYGALVPNTALAKLHTGVPKIALLTQGLWYLRDSLQADFVTLPLIVAGIIVAARRGGRARALAAGMVAYLAYVVWVGGDFMSGRFLTPPFVCAVVSIAVAAGVGGGVGVAAAGSMGTAGTVRAPRRAVLIAVALLAAGLVSPRSPLHLWVAERPELTPSDQLRGIVNERAAYAYHTGLIPALVRGARADGHPWAEAGRKSSAWPRVITYEAVGLLGFYAGPQVTLIDPMALSDAFLARLPALPGWRPGHFRRALPPGYLASWEDCLARVFPNGAFAPADKTCLSAGAVNHLEDPALRALYADVTLVTQGPLFEPGRWQAIARLNRSGAF
jgi:arabinofuranosyltransferase